MVVGRVGSIDIKKRWMLVAGSFDMPERASALVQRIRAVSLDSRAWKVADRYQVEVGPFADAEQAEFAYKLLRRRTGILALKIPPR